VTLLNYTYPNVKNGDPEDVNQIMADLNNARSIINGLLQNDNIKADAAIAYSKLALTAAILNGDISPSAAIAVSKLAAGADNLKYLGMTAGVPTWKNLDAAWPIGSIYISVVSTNPATLLGFGTWVAFGTGRTLVGIDAGQVEFDVVEETGGSKTQALTIAQLASHTHIQNAHSHSHDHGGITGGSVSYLQNTGGARDTPASGGTFSFGASHAHTIAADATAQTATNQTTGSDQAHNNLQPYIVVYMWKRTA
jgi:microcystin-dependent protein